MADDAPAAATWTGHPSQWTNAGAWFVVLIVAAAAAYGFVEREPIVAVLRKLRVPQPERVALWTAAAAVGLAALRALGRALAIRSLSYRVADGALRVESGFLSRRTELIELYRVRDIVEVRPLLMRLVGLGNVTLLSNDESAPTLTIAAVRDPDRLAGLLRAEVNRTRGRVRMIETDGDPRR